MSGGCLYVCATPLGNLEDVTLRALRVLREVDRIVAEDTRRTRVLLDRYGIATPLASCHEHNEERCAQQVVTWLREGLSVALVSDAGTPGIADPGSRVVRAAADAGFPVRPVPGPSAVTAALSVSGVSAQAYVFLGFPPRRGVDREAFLDRIALETLPVVVFESSHRIRALLADLAATIPERRLFLAREMTKRFEEYLWGTPEQLLDRVTSPQGEFVLVIAPAEDVAPAPDSLPPLPLREEVELLVAHGLDEREAIRRVARAHRLPRQLVYRQLRQAPRRD